MRVYPVYHEFEEGDGDSYDGYSSWHTELYKLFTTVELAQEFAASKEYHEYDHYTYGQQGVEVIGG